jgi:DNA polymerase III subunit beta
MNGSFIIDQKALLAPLNAMQSMCCKRTTIEATSYILFHIGHKELILKATDLEISLQAHCAILNDQPYESSSFLVHGKRLFDLVRELEGEISCTLQKNQLFLQTQDSQLALNIKDTESFPPFPERIENLLHIDSSLLIELLNKVSFLIPQNNANPSLNGLLLEISSQGLVMTTTDGYCLAQVTSVKCQLAERKQWLLPRRAVLELKKILETTAKQGHVFLGICGNQIVISGEHFNFFTRLLNDQFPQYQAILQKDDFIPAKLDKERLVKALRRSSCFLSGQFLATKFSFLDRLLVLSLENKDVGVMREELPMDEGETTLDIRFYTPYILNGLQSFDEKTLVCYLKNTTKPIIFQSVKDDYSLTYLVMPVSPTHTPS